MISFCSDRKTLNPTNVLMFMATYKPFIASQRIRKKNTTKDNNINEDEPEKNIVAHYRKEENH